MRRRIMKSFVTVKFVAFFVVFALLSMGSVFAQEIGGPYTVDDNTMLLLHFNGDLGNASQYSADGEFNGDASNFFFLPNQVSDLDQCLRIDNDSQSDEAYITVADTQYLDLTGDWTIEGWINIFTFGEGSSDWRWVPRLVIKPGDEVFWRPNYFVEMWGSTRFFSCGYQAASQDAWPQANTQDNTFVPGQWYHMAFIRDTNRHVLLTLVHNANRELINFSVADYLGFGAADPTPITTDQPVHIGYAGGGADSYLDGFVDEIRISNVVREFPIPPIISDVTKLSNQEASVTAYEIGANVYTLFSSTTIASAKLYYDAGSGWQSVDMTSVSGDSMAATIPQQPSGSVINYYLEAIDNNGLTYAYPKDAGWEAAEYNSFGIYTPMTQTLELSFEEGAGVPQDGSSYAHTVTLVGDPVYSTDAKTGSYCTYLEGDSSYLEIDSPFLTSETFAVDFWVNMDTIKTYCRILNRPGSPSSWSTNNYQVRTNDQQQLQAISDGSVSFTTDCTIDPNKWYHVIYEVQKAPEGDTCVYYGAFKLSDENDQQLFFDYAGFDTKPMQSTAPLRIGKAGTSTGAEAYPPFFKGYFDDVKVYNYPGVGLLQGIVSVKTKKSPIPLKFELSQNYPNPFNPSTEIQFAIPTSQKVTINIYNLLGKQVKTLVDKNVAAGRYKITWDGSDKFGTQVASGVYFYELRAKDMIKMRKMLLLR